MLLLSPGHNRLNGNGADGAGGVLVDGVGPDHDAHDGECYGAGGGRCGASPYYGYLGVILMEITN